MTKSQIFEHRAGRYRHQPTGYKAFIPNPLPPKPPINNSPQFQQLLSRANLALGRLDGSIQTLPKPDLFVFMYVRKEAVLSSQIEGTQSTLHDLLATEASISETRTPDDVHQLVNYVTAMNYGLNRLSTLPVSVRLIREIHERLMKGVRGSKLTPGELRVSQNWIGPPGCTIENASFVPPPPQDVLSSLGDLEKFINMKNQTPDLIKIGLIHPQFEIIHPFLDGNGRVGRLMITLLLCEKNILQKPVLYMSQYFLQNRAEYYERLLAISDRGDWEGWITFFLNGVIKVADDSAITVKNLLNLREIQRQMVTETFGRAAANGNRILEFLYEKPIVKVKDIESLLGVSYPGAINLVNRFEDIGILEQTTERKRHRVYTNRQYLEIFN